MLPHRAGRIRSHIQLCWLGLLLIRVAENATGDTWRNLRHELDRMHLVTLATADGRVRFEWCRVNRFSGRCFSGGTGNGIWYPTEMSLASDSLTITFTVTPTAGQSSSTTQAESRTSTSASSSES